MCDATDSFEDWRTSLKDLAKKQDPKVGRLLKLLATGDWSDDQLDLLYNALKADRGVDAIGSKTFKVLRNNRHLRDLDANLSKLLRAVGSAELSEAEVDYLSSFVRLDRSDWKKLLALFSREPHMPEKVRQVFREIIRDESENLDKIRFFTLQMQQAPYWEDLLASRAAAHWLEEEDFEADYQAGASISAWGHAIRWRVYTLLKSAALANRVEGDFVECGVDRGGTAMCVLHHLTPEAFANRKFYLFDTYEGLNTAQQSEEESRLSKLMDGRYLPVLDTVRETFSPYPFVEIVPGTVPETLGAYTGDRVAYLHIDMNVSLPEREALRFFWPKLSPGAPVIFDDYGFPFHVEQRKALDATAADLGAEIMMLPTGQGIMWK